MARESVRIEGLEGVVKTLRALPAELVSKNGGPVRYALRKAAVVIQKQMQTNVRSIVLEPNEDGRPTESTGLLEKNIAVKRSAPRGKKGEGMLVYVRRKMYPSIGKWKPRSTPQIARLLEYGTAKMRPHKFILPAFDAKKNEALRVFAEAINSRLAALVKKVAQANGAKL